MNGSLFTVGEAEEYSSLVQPHLTDIAQPDPECSPLTPLTIETTTPQPPRDVGLLPTASTEPVATVPTNAPALKPQSESNQECKLTTAIPEGILVEIDSGEDWLID